MSKDQIRSRDFKDLSFDDYWFFKISQFVLKMRIFWLVENVEIKSINLSRADNPIYR